MLIFASATALAVPTPDLVVTWGFRHLGRLQIGRYSAAANTGAGEASRNNPKATHVGPVRLLLCIEAPSGCCCWKLRTQSTRRRRSSGTRPFSSLVTRHRSLVTCHCP